MQDALSRALDIWTLQVIRPVADTGHARVWQVRMQGGQRAALKLYRRADRGNEAPGTQLLRHWQDAGAVAILSEADNAVLMEWLEGPTLGDIARSGEVARALNLFADTARRLHQTAVPDDRAWKPLGEVFQPLFTSAFSDECPAELQSDIQQAGGLARRLLDSQTESVPLHGDLHPDNVILTDTGPRVIDAKGYFGDPAFELANALRHPKGMRDLVRQPGQIENCLTLYSEALNVSRNRLAKWAAAKCALSIFWRASGVIGNDREAGLLRQFLQIADQ